MRRSRRGRRQAGQVERDPTQQCEPVGVFYWLEPGFSSPARMKRSRSSLGHDVSLTAALGIGERLPGPVLPLERLVDSSGWPSDAGTLTAGQAPRPGSSSSGRRPARPSAARPPGHPPPGVLVVTRFRSRLSSGSPGTTAGPLFPPRATRSDRRPGDRPPAWCLPSDTCSNGHQDRPDLRLEPLEVGGTFAGGAPNADGTARRELPRAARRNVSLRSCIFHRDPRFNHARPRRGDRNPDAFGADLGLTA